MLDDPGADDRRLLEAARDGDRDAARTLVAEARRHNDDALELELLATLPDAGSFDRLATLVDRGVGELDALDALLDAHWPMRARSLATSRLTGWLGRRRPPPRCLPLVRGLVGQLDAVHLDTLRQSALCDVLEHLDLTLEITDAARVRRARDEWLDDCRERLGEVPSQDEARVWFDNAHYDAGADAVERNQTRLEALARLLQRARLRSLALRVDDAALLAPPMVDVGRALAAHPLEWLELRGPVPLVAMCLGRLRAADAEPVALQHLALHLTTNLGRDAGAGFTELATWLRTRLVPGCLRGLVLALSDLDARRPPRLELDAALVDLLPHHPWLASVAARGLALGDLAVARLVDRLQPAHLRALDLDDNSIAHWRAVAGLVAWPRLERLSLRGNAIADFEVGAVARMASSSLEVIDLRDNPLPVSVRDAIRAAAAPGDHGADPVVGSRVTHPKFGAGTVEQLDGAKARVRFDVHGRKNLLTRFLETAESSPSEPLRCNVLTGDDADPS